MDAESKYPLLREFHTSRDWVQLRGTPSGGWAVFIGDSIGCGLWQWRAAYCGNLTDALFVYNEEADHARQYVDSQGYCSFEDILIIDTSKRKN